MKFAFLFVLGIIFAVPFCLPAQSVPSSLTAQTSPRIFFSDLESGPNTGRQKNLGVWVTIWGKGFGAERGASTATTGGGAPPDDSILTDTKITFQLGPAPI